MKNFYGNYANISPKLDNANSITIIENRNSGDEVSKKFIPDKNGVVILLLRTVKDSYMYVQATGGTVLGSLAWAAQHTSAKDLRSMVLVNKDQEIRCWGKWCDFYFIPYL